MLGYRRVNLGRYHIAMSNRGVAVAMVATIAAAITRTSVSINTPRRAAQDTFKHTYVCTAERCEFHD